MNVAIEIVPVKVTKVADSPKSWIESSDIVSMFPTYVWNMQLAQDVILTVNTRAGEVIGEMRPGSDTACCRTVVAISIAAS